MFERVSSTNAAPLYAQIADCVRFSIAAGQLSCGDALPSIRTLAARLSINKATVLEGYCELEREGLVERRQGKGTIVSNVDEMVRRRLRRAAALSLVRRALSEAARLGVTRGDLLQALAHRPASDSGSKPPTRAEG